MFVILRRAAALAMVVAAGFIGCGSEFTSEICPEGWYDMKTSQVTCVPGSELLMRRYDDTTCARCAPAPECVTDADCMRTGCSGEICAAEERPSPCIFKPEYACYAAPFASCRCDAGACGWAQSEALVACLERTGR